MDDFPWKIEPTYEGMLRAIESMHCGILVRDIDGSIVYANERMLELCGYAPQELEGQAFGFLAPPELRAAWEEERKAALEGDLRVRMTVMQRRNGRTLPVLSMGRQLRGEDDELVGTMAVIVDLGEVQTAKQVGGVPGNLGNSLRRISQELSALSLAAAAPEGGGAIPLDHPELSSLSDREREVLVELVSGSRVPAISKKLFISPHTVRNHLKAMFRKLDVANQTELIERVRALAG